MDGSPDTVVFKLVAEELTSTINEFPYIHLHPGREASSYVFLQLVVVGVMYCQFNSGLMTILT